MKAVFADTFYFLALLNRADESHGRCETFAREYRGEVLTSAYVLVEVADGLAKPQHRVQTARFIRALQNSPHVRIVPASEALLHRGLDLYASRPDKEWSLTDCISFLIMADEHLQEALTGDQHFKQAGFTPLL